MSEAVGAYPPAKLTITSSITTSVICSKCGMSMNIIREDMDEFQDKVDLYVAECATCKSRREAPPTEQAANEFLKHLDDFRELLRSRDPKWIAGNPAGLAAVRKLQHDKKALEDILHEVRNFLVCWPDSDGFADKAKSFCIRIDTMRRNEDEL